jgi:predicted AAA+ superfamily ATPase
MIYREQYEDSVRLALRRSPVCAILGPRQCGKTTLARAFAQNTPSVFFDLESPSDQTRLANPEVALAPLRGLVVLDEVQAMPAIFPVLRVLADRKPLPARFLILGSASPGIIRETSETLAGRVEFVDMGGFDLSETGPEKWCELWMRGGFPKSYLARTQADSAAWREGFIRTFLERDLPNFGIRVPAPAMRRFWTMLAHSHGQVWNASEIARSMGLSDKTVRSYLDTLTETFVVRQLQPWFENISKRQVKAPKIYLRDSGLLHALLGLGTAAQVESHPRVGASWEGFAMEQVLRRHKSQPAWFWATQSGAELDLLVQDGNKRIGYEFKLSEKPTTTRSMRVAIEDLRLDELQIICPGKISAPLDEGISIHGIETLWLKNGRTA